MTDGLVLRDNAGHNRLLYRFSAYSDVLYKAFYQIVYHSKKDISVFIAMADSLIVAASIAPEMRRDTIWKTFLYIVEGIEEGELKSLDQEFLQQKAHELAELTGNEQVGIV